jgi:tetratricopeptide (TPR) repeat protein
VRGELWDKALTYCRQAGERAAARSAYREAVAYFEQALAALAKLPERRDMLEQAIDLRFDLYGALMPLEEYARVFDYLRAAETLAERLGDNQRLGRTAGYWCGYFSTTGEHDRAIAAGQRAFALATTGSASDVQVVGQTPLGAVYYDAGDFRQALDYAQWTMALLTAELRYAHFGRNVPPAVGSRRTAAWSLAELGNFAEGRSVAEDAMRVAEAVAQPFSIATALMTVGIVSRRQGDIHTAVPILERGLALCQTANFPRLFPVTASCLGAAYALAERAAAARPLLDQALERLATGSPIQHEALVLIELSEALLLVGRVDEANALIERLFKLSHTHTGSGYQAHASRLLGEVAAQREPPEVKLAEAHYQQALALADELGMRPLQAHCHLGLGTLYNQMGRVEQARLALSTALDLYRTMEMTFWLPKAEVALAQVEGRP